MASGVALVTGATGTIGPRLIEHLRRRGTRVRALVRRPGAAAPGVELVVGDLADDDAVARAAEGVDVVYHLAAKLHVVEPPPSMAAEYRRVNVEGTRRVVAAAAAGGAGRVVYASTASVYGPTARGCVVDERTPPRPDTLYGATKLEAEEAVLAGGGVVLRIAAVYGPSMKGNYPRLVEAIRRGRLVMVGDGRNRRTLVHVDDVCAAALLAAEHAEAAGRVYNVTDGAVHELGELVAAIAAALGRRPPGLRLPAGPVRVAAGLLEDALGAVGRGAPVRRATIDKLTEDVAVSGQRLQEELGFRPTYDLRSGWRQALGGETA